MCKHFSDAYPASGPDMRNVVVLRDSQIEDVVRWCTAFDVPMPFSVSRAQFVGKLVRERRDLLACTLGT